MYWISFQMKFYEFLNLYYNRPALVDFVNNLRWSDVRRKDNNKIIPGITSFRYSLELFNCKEIKRLAEIFHIDYNSIQIVNFAGDFSYPPHTDFERKTCILFPILPYENYNPIVYHIDGNAIPVYYYGPVAVNTTVKHSVTGNGVPRINMQFDLHCSLEESIEYATSYSNSI